MNQPFKNIIPDKFSIGGVEINIKHVENEMNGNNFGSTHPFTAEIKIQNVCNNIPIAQSQKCQTFWHEVVHLILDAMGEKQEDNAENERFVTCFSNFLNEVMQSCEINDKAE